MSALGIPQRFGWRQWSVIALIVVAWLLAVLGRLLWNGDVYGLDYRLFHPDGVCYGAMAFEFAGQGIDGRSELAAAYTNQGTPIGALGPDISDPAVCSSGTRPRVLYPLLSAPLVAVFGAFGLLVVPAISWLVALLVPSALLLRYGYLMAPAVSALLVVASTSVGRWSVANSIDPLVMGLMAITLLVLPVFGHRRRWWHVAAFCVIVSLGALTRQSWPIWIAAAITPWVAWAGIHRKMGARAALTRANPWTWFALFGTAAALISWRVVDVILGSQNSSWLLKQIGSALTTPVETTPVETTPVDTAPVDAALDITQSVDWDQWRWIFEQAVSAVVVELGQLVVLDKALLIAIGLALFGAWKHRSWATSYAFLGVFAATMLLSALNTTQGINFRFALAVIPWVVLLGGSWSTPRAGKQVTGENPTRASELSGS